MEALENKVIILIRHKEGSSYVEAVFSNRAKLNEYLLSINLPKDEIYLINKNGFNADFLCFADYEVFEKEIDKWE